jgi:clan AA aspartic protease (TIGR02281 family)
MLGSGWQRGCRVYKKTTVDRMNRLPSISLVVAVFSIGMVVGWLASERSGRAESSSEVGKSAVPPPPVVANPVSPRALTITERCRRAVADAANGRFDAALDGIIVAGLDGGAEDEPEISAALAKVAYLMAEGLGAAEQWSALDQSYERITLALPEQAEYFLKLGALRLRLGETERALSVLAQIENHGSLGGRVRRMMNDAESSIARDLVASVRLPLTRHGEQFVVEATIDGVRAVQLLIDTGASVTVIGTAALVEEGYDAAGGDFHFFNTAGGIVRAPIVHLRSLRLADVEVRAIAVGAMDLALGENIDGLLGMNYLSRFDFRIDQSAPEMILAPRASMQ